MYMVSALEPFAGTVCPIACLVCSAYVVCHCQSLPVGAFHADGWYALSQRSSDQLPQSVRLSNVLTPYTCPLHMTSAVRSWRNPFTWMAVG